MINEMNYTEKRTRAVALVHEEYKGFEYLVLSYGTHPCGYVVLEKDSKLFGKNYDDINEDFGIECHCGLTYSDSFLKFLEYSDEDNCLVETMIEDKWVIGWDYAHYGDYVGYDEYDGSDKKWTTLEIVDECKEVINQLLEV